MQTQAAKNSSKRKKMKLIKILLYTGVEISRLEKLKILILILICWKQFFWTFDTKNGANKLQKLTSLE